MDQQFRWRTRALSRSNNFSLLALCCDDALTCSDISHLGVQCAIAPSHVTLTSLSEGDDDLRHGLSISFRHAPMPVDGRIHSFPSAPSLAKPSQARRSIARAFRQTTPRLGDRTPVGTRRARDISGPMAMETRPRVVYLYAHAGRTGSRRHVPTHRHVAT